MNPEIRLGGFIMNKPKGKYMNKLQRKDRCLKVARLIAEEGLTIRQATKRLEDEGIFVSKSTVHKDISERLYNLDEELYFRVYEVLADNFDERHIRGGNATRRKYQK